LTEPISQSAKPTSTARTRAFGERRRRGVRLIQVGIKETEIEALERLGYLEPGLREDAGSIRRAVNNLDGWRSPQKRTPSRVRAWGCAKFVASFRLLGWAAVSGEEVPLSLA
jgi:hypothetical protein